VFNAIVVEISEGDTWLNDSIGEFLVDFDDLVHPMEIECYRSW
jgi:hypothetical protein